MRIVKNSHFILQQLKRHLCHFSIIQMRIVFNSHFILQLLKRHLCRFSLIQKLFLKNSLFLQQIKPIFYHFSTIFKSFQLEHLLHYRCYQMIKNKYVYFEEHQKLIVYFEDDQIVNLDFDFGT
jgi:hypothetical protein